MRISSKTETLKGRRLGLPLVLLLGLFVFYPAVRAPLFLDDYLHAAMVEGTFPGTRGPFDLYDFVDDGDRALLFDRGLVPWWADPRLTIRFFRPLSSALLWAQHAAFSHAALPMHLHSFAWWALAVLAVRALYRRFFTERVALIATAIFALSPCHALPLAWVANSEILVALAFGGLALSRQLRFRVEPSSTSPRARFVDGAERSGAPEALGGLGGRKTPKHVDASTATVFFTLAILAGGEYALAFGGYVLALELAVRRRGSSLGAHVAGTLPFVAPAVSYLVARSALRYGVVGSGFYSDPFHQPGAFFQSAPYRTVALLADSWLTLGSFAWNGWERWALAAVVITTAIAVVVPIRRALATLEPASNTTARTFVWGSLVALVPTLAVVPGFRLLGISMIGVAAVSALVIDHVWFSPRAPANGETQPSRAAALGNAVALLLAFTQLVHGPVTAFLAARVHRRDGEDFAARAAWTASHVGAPSRADVGIIRGLAGTFFTPFALAPRGEAPRRWRVLSHGGHVLVLHPEPRTLELVFAENRSIYPVGEVNLYRPPSSPLRVGDVVRAAGMTVTILEVGTVGPRRVRFVFDDAPSASTWIAENFEGTVAVTLPDVGMGAPFDP